MPKCGRGRYDLTAGLEWQVPFLRRAVERRQSLTRNSSTYNVRRERARLLEAQAEKVERENAQRRGQLIAIAVFTEQMAIMIGAALRRRSFPRSAQVLH
jgi:phage terminase Nu1 subunit (DNA packaging protein)